MNRTLVLSVLCLIVAGLALSDEMPDGYRMHDTHDDQDEFSPDEHFRGFDVLPLSRAAELVEERFHGRLISARLVPPRPHEREHGAVLVHELRLLAPGGAVLIIRLDARNGDFLETAGAGLTRARKRQ